MNLETRAETYWRPMLDQHLDLPVFAAISWGCAATVWLARALNLHPDISCMDGLKMQMMYQLGLAELSPVDYLRMVRMHAAPYSLAGDVHSIGPEDVPALKEHFGDGFRACVIVRDPRPRINSFMGLGKSLGYDQHWCDTSYLPEVPQYPSIAHLLESPERRVFAHAVLSCNQIVQEQACGPIFRMEDLVSGPATLTELVEYLSAGLLTVDDDLASRVARIGRINQHASPEDEHATSERRPRRREVAWEPWQIELFDALLDPEARALYEEIGYSLSPLPSPGPSGTGTVPESPARERDSRDADVVSRALTDVTLDLARLRPMAPGVDLVTEADGSVRATFLPVGGAYGIASPPLRSWCRNLPTPAILRVDLTTEVDRVGVSLHTRTLSDLASSETRVGVADGSRTVSIYVDDELADCRLVVRNYDTHGISPRAVIRGVRIDAAASLSRAEVKKIRASEFPIWYYSMDLGDGVVTQAGTPDAPMHQAMLGHEKGRAIMQWLLDRHFGGVRDKTVVEAACSGGFHAVETARRGAKLTAFDIDGVGVGQARLAVDCLADQFAHRPTILQASIFDFVADPPADIYYCSGLLNQLTEVWSAAQIIARDCTQGAVIQTSISTLEGDLLEFAGTSGYEFAGTAGESAFIPTRSILPIMFRQAGFREQHWYDLSQFAGAIGDPDLGYRPGVPKGSTGPVYGALLK